MVSFKNLLLLAVSVSAVVLPRDAATIQTDLKTINSDVSKLNDAIAGFNGNVFSAIPVSNAESQLEDDLKKATTDAQNSGAVSSADSQSIIAYINNTLEPNIKSTLNALVAKKSQFASAGLTSTVQKDLANLKSETDSLGAALINNASSDQKSNGQAALNKLDADLRSAINAYAN